MKALIDFAMERQLAPLESLELYHKEIIDIPSQGGPPPPEPEATYTGWTGPHKGKKSSFLQPNDDYRDDIDSMNVFGVNVGGIDEIPNPITNPSNANNPKTIKTEKSDHPHSSTSPQKKTTEEMDLNTVPLSEQSMLEESKFDPILSQIEIKEEKTFQPQQQPPQSNTSAKVKEEKSGADKLDRDLEKSSQTMEGSDGKAISEKEEEDRLDDDDEDPECSVKPESVSGGGSKTSASSTAAASKKRIKKPRVSSSSGSSLQNISSMPQILQRPKRKKK
jgi:hypothetical protein